jgi:hypothetical protein
VADYQGSDPAGLTSAALFDNRVTVARYYGEHNASIDAASHALDGVTADPATVAAAIAGYGMAAQMPRLELVGVAPEL